MKPLLTIMFFLATAFAKAEAILNLNIFSCKTDSLEKSYKIKMYKDGVFFKDLLLDFKNKYETKLSNLERGVYYFEFKNIFNQLVVDTLDIAKDTLYWKSFCTDDFLNISQSFKGHIDSLSDNESFYIQYESYGCFHWNVQNLKVSKKDNQYFATLYPSKELRHRKTERTNIKTVRLNKAQLQALSDFQIDTYKNAVGFPGSTEITYYTFKYRNGKIRFVDSQEARDRFKMLIKHLYGKT